MTNDEELYKFKIYDITDLIINKNICKIRLTARKQIHLHDRTTGSYKCVSN